jgi:hypothetical protein
MKTKLISIVVIFLFSLTYATAQHQGSKISFGVLGGVNFQNLTGKDYAGDKLENKLITGFHVGANVQIPLVPEFYFQPGLLFSTKGGKYEGNSVTSTTRLSYIEVPLNFMYKGLLGTGYVFLGLGPYIGYAVMGNVQDEGGTNSLKRDIEFQNVVALDDPLTVPYAKALDVGGNIFFGYEMAVGVFAQLNAQLGLVKINPEYEVLADDKSVVKNTGFGLSLGYRF